MGNTEDHFNNIGISRRLDQHREYPYVRLNSYPQSDMKIKCGRKFAAERKRK